MCIRDRSRDDARGKDDGKGKDSDKPSDKGKDTDKLDKRALEQLSALAASGLAAKSQDAKPHWSYEGRTGPTKWGKLDPAWSLCCLLYTSDAADERSSVDLG